MAEIRNLFPYVRPYLLLLLLALLLLTASGLLEASIVLLLEPIFNLWLGTSGSAVAGTRTGQLISLQSWLGLEGDDALMRIAFFLLLFSLLKGVCLYWGEYLMSRAGQNVVAALRKGLYSHLLDQSMAFYSRHTTGQLMSRVIADTERLLDAVSQKLTDFFRQSVLLVAFLTVVLLIDWRLSLLSFIVAPVVLLITLRLGRRFRRVSWSSQQSISDISEALQETISGQRIVKAFGMEDYERGRFNRLTDRLVHLNLKGTRISALSSPVMEFLGYLLFAPFLFYANYQIRQGVSAGAFVAFIVALFKLYEPIRKLSRMHLHFEQASASSSRIFELLHTHIEIKDAADAVDLPPMRSEIAFRNVSFQYEEEQVPVLDGIDLTIQRGEIIALVGSSGAGKTTLVSLIPRFFDVTRGSIELDGTDIRTVTQRSLRDQIAIVSQDTFLFNDTVRSNIAYGRADCRQEDVEDAARAAFIHDFVEELPEGYDTLIGERGQRLSGGQRQRVAIARAILKKAPILILDEATSSLDSASERLVQKALYNLMQSCTTLVIAHRLSTIRRASRILVIEDGRILETGNHDSLMEASGAYRRLYELQYEEAGAF